MPKRKRKTTIIKIISKVMKNKNLRYSTPQSEVVELKINGILCQSPGGGVDDYENGGKI